MGVIDIDTRKKICLWVSMIGLELGVVTTDDLSSYLDEQIEKGNNEEIILELNFSISKGIKYLSHLLHEYLETQNILQNEDYQYFVEHLIIGIMTYKYENQILDLKNFGIMAYNLGRYYHLEPPLVFGDEFVYELHIWLDRQLAITQKVIELAEYVDWCQIGINTIPG